MITMLRSNAAPFTMLSSMPGEGTLPGSALHVLRHSVVFWSKREREVSA